MSATYTYDDNGVRFLDVAATTVTTRFHGGHPGIAAVVTQTGWGIMGYRKSGASGGVHAPLVLTLGK